MTYAEYLTIFRKEIALNLNTQRLDLIISVWGEIFWTSFTTNPQFFGKYFFLLEIFLLLICNFYWKVKHHLLNRNPLNPSSTNSCRHQKKKKTKKNSRCCLWSELFDCSSSNIGAPIEKKWGKYRQLQFS